MSEASQTIAMSVVSHVRARPDRLSETQAALSKLVPASRNEPGCLDYRLHQDKDDPNHLIVCESWATPEDWWSHLASAHVLEARSVLEKTVAKYEVFEMQDLA